MSSNNLRRSIERDVSTGGADSTRQPGPSSLMLSTPLELNRLDSSGRSNDASQIGGGGERSGPAPVDSNSRTVVAAPSQPQASDPLTGISTNISPLPGSNEASSAEEIPSRTVGGSGSTLLIILLLTTTGTRHPYKLDDRYLKKQNIQAPNGDPFEISIYTLKELILREWRDEWESRPSNPSSIRLIHFGRLLDDKAALKDCRFNTDTPNVVHMTVRPQELIDEDDAKNTKQGSHRDRDGRERSAGCRCEIL